MSAKKVKRGSRYSAYVSQNGLYVDLVDTLLREMISTLTIADIVELSSLAYEISQKRREGDSVGRFKVVQGEMLPEIVDRRFKGKSLVALRHKDLIEIIMLSEKVIGQMKFK